VGLKNIGRLIVGEPEVLSLAADILQRKVQTVVSGSVGREATKDIVSALVTCGMMAKTIEALRELAEHFDRKPKAE
jgi:hypothetical protein